MNPIYFGALIVGYFLVKILYGLLKMLPEKKTDEMQDFITMIVMGLLLSIFTSIDEQITIYFFIGFVIGANIPFALNKIDLNSIHYMNYIIYGIILAIVAIVVITNFVNGNPIYYGLYILTVGLLFSGLIWTRQIAKLYSTSKYDNLTKTVKQGYANIVGKNVNISYALIGWIISMLFVNVINIPIISLVVSILNGLFI